MPGTEQRVVQAAAAAAAKHQADQKKAALGGAAPKSRAGGEFVTGVAVVLALIATLVASYLFQR